VRVGGNSGIFQAVVTGTGLNDLIVTGIVTDAPGTNISAPPGATYQYIDLVPVRYASITNAVISFSVPLSWLHDRHLDPQNIVLYHLTGSTWVALPTTYGESKDGLAYFTATTPSFSRFAITGQYSPVAAASPTVTPVMQDTLPATIAAPVAGTPAPAWTTVAPSPAPADHAGPGVPLAVIGTGAAGLVILATAAVYTRRWWIHRQNPALFEDY
jgi:hypothetical protein